VVLYFVVLTGLAHAFSRPACALPACLSLLSPRHASPRCVRARRISSWHWHEPAHHSCGVAPTPPGVRAFTATLGDGRAMLTRTATYAHLPPPGALALTAAGHARLSLSARDVACRAAATGAVTPTQKWTRPACRHQIIHRAAATRHPDERRRKQRRRWRRRREERWKARRFGAGCQGSCRVQCRVARNGVDDAACCPGSGDSPPRPRRLHHHRRNVGVGGHVGCLGVTLRQRSWSTRCGDVPRDFYRAPRAAVLWHARAAAAAEVADTKGVLSGAAGAARLSAGRSQRRRGLQRRGAA